ncbi:MAG: hypothetical protein ACJ8J0_24650, partial [Longimicrobiaceae bacterium]
MPLHRLATRPALVALVTVSAGACRDVLPVEPAGTDPQAPPRMEASAVGCADLTVHTDDRAHV